MRRAPEAGGGAAQATRCGSGCAPRSGNAWDHGRRSRKPGTENSPDAPGVTTGHNARSAGGAHLVRVVVLYRQKWPRNTSRCFHHQASGCAAHPIAGAVGSDPVASCAAASRLPDVSKRAQCRHPRVVSGGGLGRRSATMGIKGRGYNRCGRRTVRKTPASMAALMCGVCVLPPFVAPISLNPQSSAITCQRAAFLKFGSLDSAADTQAVEKLGTAVFVWILTWTMVGFCCRPLLAFRAMGATTSSRRSIEVSLR